MELWLIGVPRGRVIDCTRAMPGVCRTALADPLEKDHVRGVAHVVIGFDHQQLRVEPRLGEVAFGSRVPDVGGRRGGHIRAGIVNRSCIQAARAGRSGPARSTRRGTGPGHRTMAVPMRRQPRVRVARLGSSSPKWLADDQHRGAQGQRGRQRHQHAEGGGHAKALEVGQPGEAQAGHRAGDGQTRPEDDVDDAADTWCSTRFLGPRRRERAS